MKMLTKTLGVMLILTSINISASGDIVKGKKLFRKCIMCHGKKAEGKKSQKAPKLAGQHDWYIITQLKNFQSKKRKNPVMYPFIKRLKPADFKDLAAYIKTL